MGQLSGLPVAEIVTATAPKCKEPYSVASVSLLSFTPAAAASSLPSPAPLTALPPGCMIFVFNLYSHV